MTLLELLKNASNYHKAGSRYVGPCPKCGGSDSTNKFVTKIGSDTGHCFSCGYKTDTIGYLREFDGLSCKEAHAHVGKTCDSTTCPVREKCRGEKPRKTNLAASVQAPADHHPVPTPTAPRTPADIWQDAAIKLVDRCHQALLETPQALDYLAKRGLHLGAIKKNRLGWLAGEHGKPCIYRPRSAWGLPEQLNDQDKPKKLWIPRGIIIPSFVDGRIDRLRIRRPNGDLRTAKDPKYLAIEGGGTHTVSLNPAAPAQIAVESDLDGLLLDDVAGDFIGVVILTTCSVSPNGPAAEACRNAAAILVALDFDEERLNPGTGKMERAGAKAWANNWQGRYHQAIRWPVPVGKDPGEAYAAGEDLRAWIMAGLPVSLHPKTEKAELPSPEPAAAIAPPENPTVRVIDGREVHFPLAPEQWRELVAAEKIVFGPKECKVLAESSYPIPPSELLLDVKEIFTGAIIHQIGAAPQTEGI